VGGVGGNGKKRFHTGGGPHHVAHSCIGKVYVDGKKALLLTVWGRSGEGIEGPLKYLNLQYITKGFWGRGEPLVNTVIPREYGNKF